MHLVIICLLSSTLAVRPEEFTSRSDYPVNPGQLVRQDLPNAVHLRQKLKHQFNRSIPDILLFNHKQNLLRVDLPHERMHTDNVKQIIAAFPEMQVFFYDDTQCAQAITRVHSTELAAYVTSENFGPYKSDVCRLAMLYETGGYYFDNDFDLSANPRQILPADTALTTVIAAHHDRNVFQAFLAAAPKHPVIKLALDQHLAAYDHLSLLQRAASGAFSQQPGLDDLPEATAEQNQGGVFGPIVFGNALRQWLGVRFLRVGAFVLNDKESFGNVYLFQEREDTKTFELARRSGEGCCCNVFVADDTQVLGWSRFVGAGQGCKHFQDLSLMERVKGYAPRWLR